MEDKSLFQKVLDKVNLNKIRSNSTVKKVVRNICALGLAGTLLFSTGCDNIINDYNENINPNQNNNQDNNQENREYSQILQNVLTDNYYNGLIQEAEIYKKNNDFSYIHSNAYNAIPYGFLEDEGFDVEAIKNDNLKCETEAFILNDEPNSLYLTCRVENKASTDYYTHFVLKYNLTENELKDLKLVYKDIAQGQGVSFQAPFFIQELSQVKDTVKLTEMNITKESEKELEQSIAENNFAIDLPKFGNNISVTYVKEEPITKMESDHTFAFVNKVGNSSIESAKVTQISITVIEPQTTIIDDNTVFNGVVGTLIVIKHKNTVYNSLKTATFYNSNGLNLVDVLSKDESNYNELEN